ncbi:MAG: carboxypeptidase-like regulatory domain-containing protein [Planctomycetaceae bacterium]|nr:carboxypeptidase-like regulatory domain-containing protein [Planctomycetaceae bacterium]
MKTIKNILILLMATGIPLAGCEKSGHLKGLVPAKGIITYDGQPISNATVTFVPDTVTPEHRGAYATTDERGRFIMTTLQPQDGLAPGKYKIVVRKFETSNNSHPTEEQWAAIRGSAPPVSPSPQNLSPAEAIAREKATRKHLLPGKYAEAETTDLEIEIGKKGDMNIQIDLQN